jgi:hypothetical protein
LTPPVIIQPRDTPRPARVFPAGPPYLRSTPKSFLWKILHTF